MVGRRMTELFTADEVWKTCKRMLMLRKLQDRESSKLDTLQLARQLDPNYPDYSYTGTQFNLCLASARRLIPAIELLEKIEVLVIDDIKDTWDEFRYWDLHPNAAAFLKRHDAGTLHSYLLDCKVKSYSMSPGVE